ncbi:type VII secretion-associated protein [Gordonia crocea]|uniref:type VII secretion-associated protein n=1 Tax=Gordonia crocea TaxID=589162 RepID=UPI0013799112|nr:type VII secretion-associated protein [Gordonia crocea]
MSRPLAIARSHADAGVAAVLVIATDGREWVVHLVAGAAATAAEPVLRGGAERVLSGLAASAAGVDLVVVDTPPQHLRPVMRAVSSRIGTARLVLVDPALLQRFGAHRPLPPLPPGVVAFARARPRRWPGAAAAVLVIAGVAGVVWWSRPGEAGTQTTVGGVRVDVPEQWRRTDLSGEPAPRAVFVDPATGGRVVVAVSPLRRDASADSVAASLAQRVRQRGDDAVGEFAAHAEFAGKRVTAYRETPDSGAPIRWYVRILDVARGRVQLSVGCQDSGEADVDRVCRRAVASAGE